MFALTAVGIGVAIAVILIYLYRPAMKIIITDRVYNARGRIRTNI